MATSVSSIIQVTTPSLGVPPGPIGSLVPSGVTANSVVLTWTAPGVGDVPFQYQVLQSPPGTPVWTPVTALIPGLTATITGLSPAATSQFSVLVSNLSGTNTSPIVSVTTLAVLPSAPSGLSVVGSPGISSISLTWTAPASLGTPPLTSYLVSTRTPTGVGSFVPGPTVTGTAATVSGLTSATSYDFEVAGVSNGGTGPQSTPLLNVSTAPATIVPSAPTNVTIGTLTSSSIQVSWTASSTGSPTINYVLQYGLTSTGPWTSQPQTPSTSEVVSGLLANTQYFFQMFAINGAGSSPLTSIVSGTTLTTTNGLPAAPTGLTSTAVSSTAVNLAWTAPITGATPFVYQPQWSLAGQNVWTNAPTGAGSLQIKTSTVGVSGHTNPAGQPWNSGCITSCTESSGAPAAGIASSFLFGYFETSVNVPKGGPLNGGPGFWPAFVLYPLSGPGELDIFEILGGSTSIIRQSIHNGQGTSHESDYTLPGGGDASVGFHRIGMDWQPSSITFYVDGVQTYTQATTSDHQQGLWYINMPLAVGGPTSWVGAPTPVNTPDPATLTIQYVGRWASHAAAYPGGDGSAAVPLASAATFYEMFTSLDITFSGGADGVTAVITAAGGGSFTDAGGNSWTIVGGAALENGSSPAFSANIVQMALVRGVVWHENSSLQWFFFTQVTSTTGTWTAGVDPTPNSAWMDHLAFGGNEFFLPAVNEQQYYCDIGTGNVSSNGFNPFSLSPAATPGVTITSAQILGLTQGTVYDFRVSASNSVGTGPFSSIYTISTVTTIPTVLFNTTGGSSNVSLSNGGLTVTMGGSGTPGLTPQGAVSSIALASGKGAAQFTLRAVNQDLAIGLCNANFNLVTTGGLGSDANGIGYYPCTGTGSQAPQTMFFNNGLALNPSTAIPADVPGAVITVLVDRDAGLWWVQSPAMIAAHGAGSYNDAAASATMNPSAGLGGVPIGVSGAVYLCVDTLEGGAVVDMNANGNFVGAGTAVPGNFPPWSGGTTVVTQPGPMGSIAGVPGTVSVALTWSAPTGSAPFNYIVQYRLATSSTWLTFSQVQVQAATVTGLLVSTAYQFQVYASNSAGTGTPSPILSVSTTTIQTAPGQVSGVAAGTVTSSTIPVSWQAPTSGGAVASYTVQYAVSGSGNFTSIGSITTTSTVITGLTPSTVYIIQVFATNSGGSGPVSSPPVSATTLAAASTGTRVWWKYPAGDRTLLTTPIQTTATWITSGTLISQLRNVNIAGIQTVGNFAPPFWVSQSTSDIVCTVIDITGTIPPFTMHVPAGAHSENGGNPGDNSCSFLDTSKPYMYVTMNDCRVGSTQANANAAGVVSSTNNVIVAGLGMIVQDATGPTLMAAVNGTESPTIWENGDNQSGNLIDADLTWLNANPSNNLQHGLSITRGLDAFSSTGQFLWPLTIGDKAGSGSGSIPEGVIIGIPSSTPRPPGLTRGGTALWNMFQQFGTVYNNVTVNNNIHITACQISAGNMALFNDMSNSFLSMVSSLCIMNFTSGMAGAQYGLSTMKGRLASATTWSDAYPAPPSIDYTPTGGSPVKPDTFGAWTAGNGLGRVYDTIWQTIVDQMSGTTTPPPPPPPPTTTRVVAPLTGTVNTGTWQTNLSFAAPMPGGGGKLWYNISFPQNYSKTGNTIWPVIFLGHELQEGMSGNSYPRDGGSLVSSNEMCQAVTTVAHRTMCPAIYVMPMVDQTLDTSGANGNSNGGGYGDGKNTGQNEQAILALAKSLRSSEAADPTSFLIVGASLGGIWCLAQLVDNNAYNTTDAVWAGGMTFSDQLFRPGVSNTTYFPSMQAVPLITVSTNTDNVPASFDQPFYSFCAGGSTAYPTKAQYDSSGVAALRAGTSHYYYMNYALSNPWNTFAFLNADGGDGTALWALLYSFRAGSVASNAVRARDFTSKMIVQTKLENTNGPSSSVASVTNAMAYLNPNGIGTGISIIREGANAPAASLNAMGALGYKLDLFGAYGSPGANSGSGIISAMGTYVNAGYVAILEGPLEVDNTGFGMAVHPSTCSYTTVGGTTLTGWQAAVGYQQDIWNAFHGRVTIGLFTLANPGNGAANSAAVTAASQLGTSLTSITNLGNVHFYEHNGNTPATEIFGVITQETGYTPGLKFMISESGFNDDTTGSASGQGYWGSPAVNAKYTLCLYHTAHKQGSGGTVYYELFDEGTAAQQVNPVFEGHWGLFDFSANPKPAATALRNFLAVVGDSGASAATFTPGNLVYTVSGLPSNGNSFLMQRSDGTFLLDLWVDANIFVSGQLSTAPTQTVTVTLGTASNVRVFDPIVGSTPVQTLTGVKTISVSLTDHPVVVSIP